MLMSTALLPNHWHNGPDGDMGHTGIVKNAHSAIYKTAELDDTWFTTIVWYPSGRLNDCWQDGTLQKYPQCDAGLNLKFFPDQVLWYGYLGCVALVGIVARVSPEARRLLARRLPLPAVSPLPLHGISVGIMVLGCWTALYVAMTLYYWGYVHAWHGREITLLADKLARTAGQMSNLVLGMLVM